MTAAFSTTPLSTSLGGKTRLRASSRRSLRAQRLAEVAHLGVDAGRGGRLDRAAAALSRGRLVGVGALAAEQLGLGVLAADVLRAGRLLQRLRSRASFSPLMKP